MLIVFVCELYIKYCKGKINMLVLVGVFNLECNVKIGKNVFRLVLNFYVLWYCFDKVLN